MAQKYQKFQDYLVEQLKDPSEARVFLDTAIAAYEEDGNAEAFMLSLRYLAEAKGGLAALSQSANLNRQNLYKVLAGKTVPKLTTLFSILKALGYQLRVKPINGDDAVVV